MDKATINDSGTEFSKRRNVQNFRDNTPLLRTPHTLM